MAVRGSSKRRSVDHEDFIARRYGGIRSASSGASDRDGGDVLCPTHLYECKMTGGPGEKPVMLPKFIRQLETVTEAARQEGKQAGLALRYFAPESILAGPSGWVDVMVRPIDDDEVS